MADAGGAERSAGSAGSMRTGYPRGVLIVQDRSGCGELERFLGRELALPVYRAGAEPGSGALVGEATLSRCGFAVCVLTATRAMADGNRRAAEELVQLTGLVQGRYGFGRVAILAEEGCEMPSNIAGLIRLDFAPGRVGSVFPELERMLAREAFLPVARAGVGGLGCGGADRADRGPGWLGGPVAGLAGLLEHRTPSGRVGRSAGFQALVRARVARTRARAGLRGSSAEGGGADRGRRPGPPAGGLFVTHGHQGDWRVVQAFVEERFAVSAYSFETRCWGSRPVTEALEGYLRRCSAAICVLTAEDVTADGVRVARQNLVHEVGLFQGRHGPGSVLVLAEEGCASRPVGARRVGYSCLAPERAFGELERMLCAWGFTARRWCVGAGRRDQAGGLRRRR